MLIDFFAQRNSLKAGQGEGKKCGRRVYTSTRLLPIDTKAARRKEAQFDPNLLSSGLYRRPRSFTGSWGRKAVACGYWRAVRTGPLSPLATKH
jgi:hypothetical protein